MNKTLGEIAMMCGGTVVHHRDRDKHISGVTTDSRHMTAGSLFVPLVGERFDGHKFAAQGLVEGAGATLWQRDHGAFPNPEGAVIAVDDTLEALQRLAKAYLHEIGCKIIGITGSNGKTTTKDMVAALLETTYKVHKTEGNFNNHIGLPLTILGMSEGVDIVVLEMGMSGRGEIEKLSSIAHPDVAIITNIGESHLLQLGSRQEIAAAKLEIVSGMKQGGLLIYNGDEPLIPHVLSESSTVKDLKTFTFGFNSDNDDYPTGMMFHGKGIIFTSYVHKELGLDLPLLGRHNVLNGLAALAVARHFAVSEDNIREGLSHLKLTGMRIEPIVSENGLTVLNDAYNASPTSVKAAIDVLQSMKGYRRKIAVLGDMLELGTQEAEYHTEIGKYITTEKLDLLYTFGPLSSHTAKAAIANLHHSTVFAFTDKAELIHHLKENIDCKDIVLVKGSRGMKLEEVVNALIE
ncbi:UDP-N-acetylmuramoyl-tripeptide--D-alanyl-D-alanine ligase [Paenibacillus crassostreae]|uniref:UDP-N-acetylmuramoyl-tripeptide--D-alanyl-D- alanine ligase n=1 Tax=Paenibacillus crassostreae TaxID=1763538 RepID=UPI002FCBE0E4